VNTACNSPCGSARPWLVADTQVVLDWLVFADTGARPLLEAVLEGRLRWLATTTMRTELQHMLRHPSLSRWGHEAEPALTFFDQWAFLIPDPAPSLATRLACSDPDDQVFIDTALAHDAAWLATRDRALLTLRRKALLRGLRIIEPREWRDADAPP